jgi:sialidase-1
MTFVKHKELQTTNCKPQTSLRLRASAVIVFLLSTIMVAANPIDIVITQQHYQVPVLVHKKDNPVLRIHITVNAGTVQLTDMLFNAAGSSSVKDIKLARLFYAGQDSGYTNLNNLEKLSLFGSTDRLAGKLRISGHQTLAAGSHFFWLSVELHDKADLLHLISIHGTSAMLSGKQHTMANQQAFQQRIALALRQHNQDNVHTYRIPGLATAKDGSLLAIYDARRESGRDLQGDIDIGVSRSTDHGNSWRPMQIVLDMGKWGGLPEKFNGVSDACILVDKNTGNIFIAGLWMHGVLSDQGKWIEGLHEGSKDWNHQWRNKGSQPGFDVKQTAQFMVVKSEDNGKTWSKPVNLTNLCKQEDWWLWAPAPGQGITLQDGTLVFPTQGRDKTGKAFSAIAYSKDGGQTWKVSRPAVSVSTTENMAVELTDGSIMLNMRSSRNRTDTGSTNGRAVAVTSDLGQSWTEHSSSRGGLPEPTCMASIIRHDFIINGKKRSVLLFSNPDSKTVRHRMTIKVSSDDGKTWSAKKVLLDEWKSRGYSCLTSIGNDTIGILYESSQADLVFQKIALKDLL